MATDNVKSNLISLVPDLEPTGLTPPHNEEEKLGFQVSGKPLLPHLDKKAQERFEEKVDYATEHGQCHTWTASIGANGYGRFTLAGKAVLAHRVAWVMANGKEISPGHEIHHVCKNRSCVNSEHLCLVTHAENMSQVDTPPSEEDNQERGWAHQNREPIQPLPHDAGARFLGWMWAGAHERYHDSVALVRTQERKLLREYLKDIGNERSAYLALISVIKEWGEFTRFASRTYGIQWGKDGDPPPRPSLRIIRKHAEAVVNFWRDRDPTEREIMFKRKLDRVFRDRERVRAQEYEATARTRVRREREIRAEEEWCYRQTELESVSREEQQDESARARGGDREPSDQ